jgi:hypothetical protein
VSANRDGENSMTNRTTQAPLVTATVPPIPGLTGTKQRVLEAIIDVAVTEHSAEVVYPARRWVRDAGIDTGDFQGYARLDAATAVLQARGLLVLVTESDHQTPRRWRVCLGAIRHAVEQRQ